MSISYKPLFTIRVQHDYYHEGIAKGIEILPSPTTQRQMRSQRMMFRNMPYGAVVLYQTVKGSATTPFISLPEELVFTFSLYARDQGQFFNISAINNTQKLIYFENDPSNTLAEEVIANTWLDRLEPSLFTTSFTDSQVNLVLQVQNRKAEQVRFAKDIGTNIPLDMLEISAIDPINHRFEQQVDLRHLPEGPYQVVTDGDYSERLFVSQELARKTPIAIAEIVLREAGTTGSNKQFLLQFERRSTIWKFYIINKTKKASLASHPPIITLNSAVNPSSVYGTPTFTSAIQVLDEQKLVQGLETWKILSMTPLPFYEHPLLNLELFSGNHLLVNHLPSASSTTTLKWDPDEQQYESEIYIYV